MTTFAESELLRIDSDLSYANESIEAYQRVLADSTASPLRRAVAERNIATYQKKIADLEAQKIQYQAKISDANIGQQTASESEKSEASSQTASSTVDTASNVPSGAIVDENSVYDSESDAIDSGSLDSPDSTELSDEELENLGRSEYEPNDEADQQAVDDALTEDILAQSEPMEYDDSEIDMSIFDDAPASQSASAAKSQSAEATLVPSPTVNRLHSYATYTYGISLFILSKEESNLLTENPNKLVPKYCLISSGGRHDSTLTRHPEFKDDFYFQDLRLTTVIGMNSRSKASNAVEISFSIIEPYGLTLLDRVIAASKLVASKNYLEMPYMLQVDFFGSDDNGKPARPIPGTTKRLPMKIIELKAKVSTKGAEYSLRAIPFNHQAFQESAASTPVNLEIDADTVQSFFSDQEEKIQTQIDERNDATAQAEAFKNAQQYVTNEADKKIYQQQAEALAKKANSPIRTSSYTGGVNSWYRFLKDSDARRNTDTIKFVIDPDIAKSSIVRPDRTEPGRTPIPDPGSKEALAVKKNEAAGPNFKSSAFSINAGTSVMRVIDMVMRNSDYVTNQIKDPASADPQAAADKLGKPLDWYKVIPQINLKEFDEKTNRWSKEITYYIKKYTVYNSKHVYGPQSKPAGAVKSYDYMYTGKNNDVIDFQIDFDTLYYTAVQANRSGHETISGAAAPTESKPKENSISNPSGGKNSAFPIQITPIADDPGANAGLDGNRNSVTKTAADIQKSLYSGTRGDMLNLKLKILGDPDFIKQDDVYMNPSVDGYDDAIAQQTLAENGSLVMDSREIHCRVTFKTPTDIDERTGLMRSDGKYVESVFSGLYRVLTVATEFRSGKFEQTLDMIRIFDDVPSDSKAKSAQRETATTTDANSRSLPGQSVEDQIYEMAPVEYDDSDPDMSGFEVDEDEFTDTPIDYDDTGLEISEEDEEFVQDEDYTDLAEITDEAEEFDIDEYNEQLSTIELDSPINNEDQWFDA